MELKLYTDVRKSSSEFTTVAPSFSLTDKLVKERGAVRVMQGGVGRALRTQN